MKRIVGVIGSTYQMSGLDLINNLEGVIKPGDEIVYANLKHTEKQLVKWATKRNIKCKYLPAMSKARKDFSLRNAELIGMSDLLIIFDDGACGGTEQCIRIAQFRNKNCTIIKYGPTKKRINYLSSTLEVSA